MIEGSMMMITLFGMLICIMDMGRILLMQEYLTERARTTARKAVVNNWTAAEVQNYLVYNNTTAPDGGGAGYLGVLPSQVSYQALGTAGKADYRLQVKVSGVPVLTWIPYIAGSYTLAPIVATMPAQSLGATT
jgi:hypothetical protein